jgi:hypothetical protein
MRLIFTVSRALAEFPGYLSIVRTHHHLCLGPEVTGLGSRYATLNRTLSMAE